MKCIIALFICTFFCSNNTSAQTLSTFKQKLSAPDSLYSSKVSIQEDDIVASRLANNKLSAEETQVNIYRVNIFFDNSQNARTMAQETRDKFHELFTDIPSYLVYENPYFKLTVGNCTSVEEAIVLLGKVNGSFERAFVSRENVSLSTLLE